MTACIEDRKNFYRLLGNKLTVYVRNCSWFLVEAPEKIAGGELRKYAVNFNRKLLYTT